MWGDILLPRLERLGFTFSCHDQSFLKLSWLKQQPCKRLELIVMLSTIQLPQHQQVMGGLRELQLSKLSVVVRRQFYQSAAAMELTVPASWHDLDVHSTGGFSRSFKPLQVLPRSHGKAFVKLSVSGTGQNCITWPALAAHTDIILEMDGSAHFAEDCEMHYLGASSAAPDHLQQPWQLTVRHPPASSVHGLCLSPQAARTSAILGFRVYLRYLAGAL